MDADEIVRSIDRLTVTTSRPITVGISGFCGSGKSTLARQLVGLLPSAVRMRGDDFLDPARSHRRSTDWDGVERRRLADTVLAPFRERRATAFQRYDWTSRRLGPPEPLPRADVMIVDLIGLFHPDSLPALDLTVWCDVDLETASARGRHRDRALGRHHDTLWDEIWIPNEIDFDRRFAPRSIAAVRVPLANPA